MDGEACHCVLAIELSPDRKRMRIEEESLAHESKHIFESMQGMLQRCRDEYSKGTAFPCDWALSGIGLLNESPANKNLTKFKNALASFVIASPCPPLFESESRREHGRPDMLDRQLEKLWIGTEELYKRTRARLETCLLRSAMSCLDSMQ